MKLQKSAHGILEIEYVSDAPPPIDLRQQIEQALPANRYRLLRIARRFQNSENSNLQQSKIDLEPPTPEKLFLDLWKKWAINRPSKPRFFTAFDRSPTRT